MISDEEAARLREMNRAQRLARGVPSDGIPSELARARLRDGYAPAPTGAPRPAPTPRPHHPTVITGKALVPPPSRPPIRRPVAVIMAEKEVAKPEPKPADPGLVNVTLNDGPRTGDVVLVPAGSDRFDAPGGHYRPSRLLGPGRWVWIADPAPYAVDTPKPAPSFEVFRRPRPPITRVTEPAPPPAPEPAPMDGRYPGVKRYPRALVKRNQAGQWTIRILTAPERGQTLRAVFRGPDWAGTAAAQRVDSWRETHEPRTSEPKRKYSDRPKRGTVATDPGTCKTCERPMRPAGTKSSDWPGTVLRQSEGLCQTDYLIAKRKGQKK